MRIGRRLDVNRSGNRVYKTLLQEILYQINLIRSLLIEYTVARHGDLTLQIRLIGYNTKLT